MNSTKETIDKIVKKYGTIDPFEIARAKNILVLFDDLGQTYGFYHSYKRVKMIHINTD